MTYRLDMDGETRLLISHLPPLRKKKVKQSMRAIALDPLDPLTGKPLQEELMGLYSYRLGSWRIIYSVNSKAKKVHIVALGPRKTIYEDLAKDLRKHPPPGN